MKNSILSIMIFILLISAISCKKDLDKQCENLKEAFAANDEEKAKGIINKFIAALDSKTYTEENINKLAQSIAGECGIVASSSCFDCIQTLPSQSEIMISFSYNGIQKQKVIDLSYSEDNKIVFLNMHD